MKFKGFWGNFVRNKDFFFNFDFKLFKFLKISHRLKNLENKNSQNS